MNYIIFVILNVLFLSVSVTICLLHSLISINNAYNFTRYILQFLYFLYLLVI